MMCRSERVLCEKRSAQITLFFLLWTVILISAHFYFAVIMRDHYRRTRDSISLRRGVIPAVRGEILDRNGVKLAWTEVRYDLVLTHLPGYYLRKKRLIEALAETSPEFRVDENVLSEQVIYRNLSTKMIHDLQSLFSEFNELQLKKQLLRRYSDPELSDYVGRVKLTDGIMVGVSGMEKKYDKELAGRNAVYVVMVDSCGNWIPGKWRSEKKMVPGTDIILNRSVEDIKGMLKH